MREVDVFETDLPADFQELASQLSADADRLSEVYPARPEDARLEDARLENERAVERSPFVADRNPAARPQRWPAVARAAAAVAVLAGTTLAFSYVSAWRGTLVGKPNEGATAGTHGAMAAATVPSGSAASSTAASATAAESLGQTRPVSISAEALRLSGEQIEILRHATQGEVVEVDI